MKHIHILGICGTFMGSLAALAKEKGLRVTGCDQGVYPPMSTQLESLGIELIQGFDSAQLELEPDLFIVGNAISRGNSLLEEILDKGLPYTSGPQFLSQHILQGKWVLAVSGTHGKTTTTTMLAWILECSGMSPGFLIGGVPKDFEFSARLGGTPFFVIEADEYDSAFFDKRSKFVHYQPRTLIVNNLEFDHADIFEDLPAIQKQFHHVIRTVPRNGRVIYPANVQAVDAVIDMGIWSEQQCFSSNKSNEVPAENGDAQFRLVKSDGSEFEVLFAGQIHRVSWNMTGEHNVSNALAAMLAARHVGVELEHSAAALSRFGGIKRRMEKLIDHDSCALYDDFAHHPSAIMTTLQGLREKVGADHILALIEPRSNTMRMGIHEDALVPSAEMADQVIWADLSANSELAWLLKKLPEEGKQILNRSVDELVDSVMRYIQAHQGQKIHVLMMSNGGFGGLREALEEVLSGLPRQDIQ
ncbi:MULTISPECIES: UDP-N-acetylmuramate:L-alanyl-gamma-D-glutamyl-meso-diaminopimelate ligase [unclassified Oleiphilus]|uniref:UDP-N-acetylmuramate:L-alanyl-gamma-D-glutamyl- meso-diaminopimelate ligase n=1 Tax=unclassified Oleiphilus TaxID=2631174 RepID=UPI0026F45334|nr:MULTISPECIES: UDP-N-acetylmuramate:L-alanyl-gamma-D-glutamyl-meso-diaminopimelate ligase [unclassified Oleiphilus]